MTDHTLTFGDLCCAIADGRLAATLNGSMYEINALELRRYLSGFFATQTRSHADAPTTPLSGDVQEWGASTPTSVV